MLDAKSVVPCSSTRVTLPCGRPPCCSNWSSDLLLLDIHGFELKSDGLTPKCSGPVSFFVATGVRPEFNGIDFLVNITNLKNYTKLGTAVISNLINIHSTNMSAAALDSSKLTITKCQGRKSYPPKEELGFGKVTTDHILTVEWDHVTGWGTPEIKPYAPFQMDPATSVLHYAFECFEGQKAFWDVDGDVRIFRPEENMKRLNKSCRRICLPEFPVEEGVKLLKEFVRVESEVIPKGEGYALYLRPTCISTNVGLGVAKPTKSLLYIIASPVGPALSSNVTLEATDYATRAWPGGTGDSKLGGNYAPCVLPQEQAASRGFTQNLWLFNGYLTEVGMMNLFLVFANEDGTRELTTAPLDGIILEGITRSSILEIAREKLDPKKWIITERRTHVDELLERSKKGQLLEIFGAGTAAIVKLVDAISYHGTTCKASGSTDEVAPQIRRWIWDIQYGVQNHPFCQKI